MSVVQLHVVAGDELPIYRQIMRQITDAVAGGHLQGGDQLPSQRELAEQLVISPLTVKKAYDELERQGLVTTRRGKGTFVRDEPPELDAGERRRRLEGAVRRLLSQAHLSGTSLEEVQRLVREIHQQLQAERRAREEAPPTAAEEPEE